MYINFNSFNSMLLNMSERFNVKAELYNYSDANNAQSITKVFRNYVKLYVNEKIALEVKFDKNSFEFKEFMCDAKRSRFVATELVRAFNFLDFRFTKKQTFVTCNDMTNERFEAIIYSAVFFALKYDNEANSALYRKASELKKSVK